MSTKQLQAEIRSSWTLGNRRSHPALRKDFATISPPSPFGWGTGDWAWMPPYPGTVGWLSKQRACKLGDSQTVEKKEVNKVWQDRDRTHWQRGILEGPRGGDAFWARHGRNSAEVNTHPTTVLFTCQVRL